LAVPYAAPILANTNADVTPMNPKKGALAGHVSKQRNVNVVSVYVCNYMNAFS
jgi:hypothetical protein